MMKINVIADWKNKKIDYVFNQIFRVLGYDYSKISIPNIQNSTNETILIIYGKDVNNIIFDICICKNTQFEEKLADLQLLLSNDFKNKYIAKEKNNIFIQYDIIQTIFFFLSRQEEYRVNRRGKYDRFPHTNSISYKLNILDLPVVDILINILGNIIEEIANKKGVRLNRKTCWSGKKFAVCLTHDVDTVKGKSILRYFFWVLVIAKNILFGNIRSSKAVFRRLKKWLFMKKDSYWSFDDIVRIENKYNFKSSFYFLSLTRSISREGRRYNIKKASLKKLTRDMNRETWEIGLHGSFYSHLNKYRLGKEKERLEMVSGKNILGIRQHYLRFKVPLSWKVQQNIGLKYDCTLGWAEEIGFRAGTMYPFYPYDLENDEVLNILEIPLIIMDGVFDKKYGSSITDKTIFFVCKKYFDLAEKYGGVITLLWHTDRFAEIDFPYYKRAYERILEYLTHKSVFVGTGEGIFKHWTESGNQ